MDMTLEEYTSYLNHLFIQRMDDSNYLAFMLQSNLGEM
jgi:hypothetical protein